MIELKDIKNSGNVLIVEKSELLQATTSTVLKPVQFNKEDVVLRFIQSILENTSRHDAKVVVLVTKGKDESFIKKASQFFEEAIGGE